MPMSEAALAGISANGHRWKHQLRMSHLTSQLGEPKGLTTDDLAALRDQIVEKVRSFNRTTGIGTEMYYGIESKLDDLEMVDSDVVVIREALNDLYDEFDYWRVCIL